jgi:hypothetical protein
MDGLSDSDVMAKEVVNRARIAPGGAVWITRKFTYAELPKDVQANNKKYTGHRTFILARAIVVKDPALPWPEEQVEAMEEFRQEQTDSVQKQYKMFTDYILVHHVRALACVFLVRFVLSPVISPPCVSLVDQSGQK